MKQALLILMLVLLTPSRDNGQFVVNNPAADDVAMKKLWLVSDLQALDGRSSRLDGPLARASAKTEIADAAWGLDNGWAKKLLNEAYELTFPPEEEQIKLRKIPAGAAPTPPTAVDWARLAVRRRVLQVAGRNHAFAGELVKQGAERLGKLAEHVQYAALASEAIDSGNNESAGEYILEAVNADPTQITAASVILDIAVKDRALADRLILEYIERLRTFPLATANLSTMRVFLLLHQLLFNADFQHRQIAPPGAAVVRAYVSYVIESLGMLEQREPGSLRRSRGLLLTVWQPLRSYAPELTSTFLALERLSQTPGGDTSLPAEGSEAAQKRYEQRVSDALNGDRPDELLIHSALSRGDFGKARKLIDKLPDGLQKLDLLETANMREAISLAAKGDLLDAETLAKRLRKTISVLQVYPLMIQKCAAKKDQSGATNLVHQAMKQLKHADPKPSLLPAGIPLSAAASNSDPLLLSLSKLAKAVTPINEGLALEVLDETVEAANHSGFETGQGRTGFEMDIFKTLAPGNEERVRQAAGDLRDPLRQIVALATINQWKAQVLIQKEAKY